MTIMTLEQVRDWHRITQIDCQQTADSYQDDPHPDYQKMALEHKSMADAIESAIAERKVPHGWQLVPIVPTLAMLVAGRQTLKGSSDEADGLRAKAVYTRMLAAAPKVTP